MFFSAKSDFVRHAKLKEAGTSFSSLYKNQLQGMLPGLLNCAPKVFKMTHVLNLP